ncbi:Uncharacterised protein [Klebsiella pneumoniae]|nr:Uncharacterised protein [Klebsiella pneumoniae]SLX21269.1 Uncharacterised protein [Klebsiella variicola]SLS97638.1 Uncharacterised protein [Klebsiella pneumoniae]SLT23754.1 Uncharacterised protein [Klebsiella pneumoniae]SLW90284.1 Uncharacterised protein [Klebsiella pneumoniae]
MNMKIGHPSVIHRSSSLWVIAFNKQNTESFQSKILSQVNGY